MCGKALILGVFSFFSYFTLASDLVVIETFDGRFRFCRKYTEGTRKRP